MINNKIVVLGANGFIGLHLCNFLAQKKYNVIALVRDKNSKGVNKLENKNIKIEFVGNLFNKNNLKVKYSNIICLVNLAALAHIGIRQINEKNINLDELNNIEENIVNNFSDKNLNIIHISTAKVLNIIDSRDKLSNKLNIYDNTKAKSEEIIRQYYKKHIILRPPLIYGPEVKANFKSLMKIIHFGIPLPFKKFNNKRSYMYIENLCDAIFHIIQNKHFTGKSYYISDNFNCSTSRLIKILTKYLSKKLKLFYLPKFFIKFIFKIFRKKSIFYKLEQSFIVNNQEFINDTSWRPPYSSRDGIKNTCLWYKREFKIRRRILN